MDMIEEVTATRPAGEWIAALEAVSVPCGPVNTLSEVFSDPQTLARDMRISLPHDMGPDGQVELIGNPLKFSDTPVTYRNAPPKLGEHTDQVLRETLGLDEQQIAALRANGVLAS